MLEHKISWWLCSENRSFDEKSRCGFWIYELNAEWKIKCVCEQKLRKPSFLEFHRKTFTGDNMISGTLEIYNAEKHPLKKKIICLLEDGYLSTRMDFPYLCDTTKSSPKEPLIEGNISINDGIETSLDLTELFHFTNSDYLSLIQLSGDMEKLLGEKSFLADVTLKCGSVSIPANKNVLSARSPVFEAMFRCPTNEAMESVIIEDVEEPVFQALLKYMYTGKTEDLTTLLAIKLLFVANKYKISCLEYDCNKYLMSNMSLGNIASFLLIVDCVSPDLKSFAIDFLCKKCNDYSSLEKNEDWIALKESKPALMLEIFSAIIKSQEQKLKLRS